MHIVEVIRELTDRGTDLKSFTKDLMQFFRDLLVAKVVRKPEEVLDASESELSVMSDLVGRSSEEHLTLLLSEMIRTEGEVRAAFSPRAALEMALIRASFLNVLKPIQEAIDNLESFVAGTEGRHEKKQTVSERPAALAPRREDGVAERAAVKQPLPAEQAPAGEPPAPALAEEAAPPEDRDIPGSGNGEAFRDQVIRKLEEANHLLAIKLSEASMDLEGDSLVIAFSGGTAIHADSVKKNMDTVRGAVEGILGKRVSIKVETVKKKIQPRKELKETLLSEPLVKEAIELFEGRLVDIRAAENTKNGGSDV